MLPSGTPARIALFAGPLLILAAVVSQLVLPGVFEQRIEDRLSEGGGSADVQLEAIPAARLLFDDGDRFEASGSGLDLDVPEERIGVLTRLDGFGEVALELRDSEAGPFELASFSLHREGDGPYTMRTSATTSGADLVAFGVEGLGLGLALPALGFLTARSEEATRRIPIELDMEMLSDENGLRVSAGGGTIAGYPTGPLAELIVATILARI